MAYFHCTKQTAGAHQAVFNKQESLFSIHYSHGNQWTDVCVQVKPADTRRGSITRAPLLGQALDVGYINPLYRCVNRDPERLRNPHKITQQMGGQARSEARSQDLRAHKHQARLRPELGPCAWAHQSLILLTASTARDGGPWS